MLKNRKTVKMSVIMSTYNERKDYIRLSIESILQQTFSDFEFIIVLDNPDNIGIENLILDYQKRDSRIVVIKNEENIGLAKSLNKALKVAKGEYIARMDADDIAYPERLEQQLIYMNMQDLDLVGAYKEDIDEGGKSLSNNSILKESPQFISKAITISNCIAHPTWLLRKEVYDLLKGYRSLPRSQDYDFLLRARLYGVKMGVCDQCLLAYRVTSTGVTQSGKLKQLLTSRYLAHNYKSIESISLNDMCERIEKKASREACENFNKATEFFIKAKRQFKKNPLKAGYFLFKAMCTSKFFVYTIEVAVRRRILFLLYGYLNN